jgi:TolB protein
MMRKRGIGFLSLFAIILSACGPGQALGPTVTPSPTRTLEPTSTPMPTATATPTPTPTPIGRGSGKLLFIMENKEKNNNHDICIIDIDTGVITNLTEEEKENIDFYFPYASPDGQEIIYSRVEKFYAVLDSVTKSELFIMNINGENNRKITNIPMYSGTMNIEDRVSEAQAVFSHDGGRIAFFSNRNELINRKRAADSEIYIMDFETNEITQLTNAKGTSEHPTWSPDGSQIAFMSDRDGDWDIYIVNVGLTGKVINITNNRTSERFPSWSNNGRYIVYHSDRDGNNQLFIYDLESKEETRLTTSPGSNITGRWSPDDKWIAFSSDRDGDYDIYIINIETKEEIKITDNKVDCALQNWIP